MATPVPEQHIVQILSAEYVANNVRRFKLSKPDGYTFKPGQATEIRDHVEKLGDEYFKHRF